MFKKCRKPVFAAAVISIAAFVYLVLMCGAAVGQTPRSTVTPTPSPTPNDALPVPRIFDSPPRPMPPTERIGVDASEQLALTLDQAIEMALKNNNDIEESRKDTQIANFSTRAAKGVYDPLFSGEHYFESATTPTASAIGGAVNGSVTQTRLFQSDGISGLSPYQGGSYSATFNSSRTTSSNTNSFLNPQYPSSLALSYTQPLFRNRSIDNSRRLILIAKKNESLTDSQLRQKAIDTITSVEQSYWDLVYALRNLQVQTDTLKQAKEQLESNKRLVAQGVLAPIEVVAANAQIYTFEQNVFAAQETITRSENALKTIILPDRTAADWSRPLMPVTPVTQPVPQIGLPVAVAEALKNRPEIDQLNTNSDINQINERYFRNQTKPQIDLVGSYTPQGLAGTTTPAAINPTTGLSRVPPNLVGGYFNSIGNLFQQDYPTYRASVIVSFPFGNHVAKANLGSTLVQGARIKNQLAQTEQTIESDVRNSLQTLRSAESRLSSATAARIAAEELYSSEARQFRSGTSTFYLVLQRQTDLNTARGREIQAQTDLNKAISTFNHAIGTTLTVNNVTVVK